jgi:general secretion pathway protein K
MMRNPRADSAGERGFVIVAVLWILMALSTLAMVFAMYLSASARALAINDAALQSEALVSAGVELTAYQLALAGQKERPPRGAFQFRMDDASVLVTFTSEAARIDLNFAPKEVLAKLFAVLGASEDAARADAERIVGWRTRPVPGSANQEEALYNSAGYVPRQALFAHVNELALVIGLPPQLVERALPFVTVFNRTPDVDPEIAAPEVRAAVPNKANQAQDPFGGGAVSPNGTPVDPAAQAPGTQAPSNQAPGTQPLPTSDAATAKSQCYRIEATISFHDGRRTASEVVIALGDNAEPYRVLSWQDDVVPRSNAPGRRSL